MVNHQFLVPVMRTCYNDKTFLCHGVHHLGFYRCKVNFAALQCHLRIASFHIDQLINNWLTEIVFIECLILVCSMLLAEISILEWTRPYKRTRFHIVHRIFNILPDVLGEDWHCAANILHEWRIRAAHIDLYRVFIDCLCPIHSIEYDPAIRVFFHVAYGKSNITGSYWRPVVPFCIFYQIEDIGIFIFQVFPVFC